MIQAYNTGMCQVGLWFTTTATKKTLFSSPLLILLIQAQSIVRLVLSHDLYL